MLPYVADFAAVSGSNAKPGVESARKATADLLGAIVDMARSRLPNSVIEQVSASPFTPSHARAKTADQVDRWLSCASNCKFHHLRHLPVWPRRYHPVRLVLPALED